MTIEELQEGLKSRYWRLNNLYWIIDKDGVKVKFKMKYVQYIFYTTMWWLNLILKSRQHGITTIVCILFLDACLFTPNIRAGIICHKMSAAKSFFRTKVKYAYDHLPESLKQQAQFQTLTDTTEEIVFANNSSIYVTSSVRSDSIQLLHISEYSWICQHAAGKASEIKTGALPALARNGIGIIECTAEGVGDDFERMCRLAEAKSERAEKLTKLDWKFFFYGWYLDPANQLFEDVDIPDPLIKYFEQLEAKTGRKLSKPYRNWYTKTKEVFKELMYKEYPSTSEEAFWASIEGSILGRKMIAAKEDERICTVPHDPTKRVFTAWDLGTMHTAIWFAQFKRDRINLIDYYEDNTGAGAATYARAYHSKPYNYCGNVCGWDILGPNKKDWTGRMVRDLYAGLGVDMNPLERTSVDMRIAAARHLIDLCCFDGRKCGQGVTHLMNYRMEKDESASTEEHTIYKKIPFHDAASHAADAFSHLALAYRIAAEEGRLPGESAKIIERSGIYDPETAGVTNLLEI